MTGVLQFLRSVLAVLVVAAAGLLAFRAGWFDPVPFTDVAIESVTLTDDRHLMVRGSFVRTEAECRIQTPILAYGVLPLSTTPLTIEPVRDPGVTIDRRPGPQTFHWDIYLDGWFPASVEVWARYDCGGRIIDLMIARFDVPPIQEIRP